MSVVLLLLLIVVVCVYWFITQVRPEHHKSALVRNGLSEGLLADLNERRHLRGLPILELDDDLAIVAENKAVHQVMSGQSDAGWEYPEEYRGMFGRSLLMEALLTGAAETMADRLARQRDAFDGEWVRCGLGCAGGRSGQVVVALILCREAWELVPEVAQARGFAEAARVGQ